MSPESSRCASSEWLRAARFSWHAIHHLASPGAPTVRGSPSDAERRGRSPALFGAAYRFDRHDKLRAERHHVPQAGSHPPPLAVSSGHGPDPSFHDQDQLHRGAGRCGLAQAGVDLGDERIAVAPSVLRPSHGIPLVVRGPAQTTATRVARGGCRSARTTLPRALCVDSRRTFRPVRLPWAANVVRWSGALGQHTEVAASTSTTFLMRSRIAPRRERRSIADLASTPWLSRAK